MGGGGGLRIQKWALINVMGWGFVCVFYTGWIVSPKPEPKFLDSHIPTCHHLYDCCGVWGGCLEFLRKPWNRSTESSCSVMIMAAILMLVCILCKR